MQASSSLLVINGERWLKMPATTDGGSKVKNSIHEALEVDGDDGSC